MKVNQITAHTNLTAIDNKVDMIIVSLTTIFKQKSLLPRVVRI